MKYLKRFENINESEVVVGDYVLLKPKRRDFLDVESIYFFENVVGEVIMIHDNRSDGIIIYSIKYNNIPGEIIKFFNFSYTKGCWHRNFYLSDIIFFSKNREDVEDFIQSKKYNL